MKLHDGIFKTASRSDNRNGSIPEAVHLVQSARLVIRRHKKEIASRLNPMSQGMIVADPHGNSLWMPDGQVFDTTEKKGGKPLVFEFGGNQIIPGIEQVVGNMRPGEEVQALIPADLAYGDKGVCTDEGCLIKPNTNLKYFLRLKRIAASAG